MDTFTEGYWPFLAFFISDYANSRCQSYDIDTNSRSGRKRLEKDSIVNFFEKICLRGGKFSTFFVSFYVIMSNLLLERLGNIFWYFPYGLLHKGDILSLHKFNMSLLCSDFSHFFLISYICYIKGTYWHYINSICPFYVAFLIAIYHMICYILRKRDILSLCCDNMSLLCSIWYENKMWKFTT